MNESALTARLARLSLHPDFRPFMQRLILSLAVRGKLTERDDADEPVAHVLRIAGIEPLHPGDQSSTPPFALPDTWAWVALGQAFVYDAGIKISPNDLKQDRWLLELEDIEGNSGRLLSTYTVSDRAPSSTKSEFQPGDVLYGKLRPYLNKAVVANVGGYSTTELVTIRAKVPSCPDYVSVALRRPDFVDYVTRLGRGTKMPRLRTEDAVSAPFPMPPVAEQYRIVAKVDELMTVVDELESARAERESRRNCLREASLRTLVTADAVSQKDSAQFFLSHSERMITRPEHVKRLRQTILDLAVTGRLVPQDPSDEPAHDLRKATLRKRWAILRANPYPGSRREPESPKDGLPDLPNSWTWATIDELASRIADGPHRTPNYVRDGIPFITVKNLTNSREISFDGVKYITHEDHAIFQQRAHPRRGDILLSKDGATLGVPRVVRTDREFSIFVSVALISVVDASMSDYLALAMQSRLLQDQFVPKGAAIPHIHLNELRRDCIPLAPIAEQRRIVAKVDELMTVLDRLEASLASVETQRRRVLEALLHEALNGTGGEPSGRGTRTVTTSTGWR